MFFATARATARKQQTLNELASETRSIIRNKFKELDSVDEQLKQAINETKELASSIREKLATQLKITKKTLKSVCHNLRDGVIIVNCEGKILDVNPACERFFGHDKSEILGYDFNFLTRFISAERTDGTQYELGEHFFEDLSHSIFYHLSCINDNTPKIDLETYKLEELSKTDVKIKQKDTKKVFSISVSALDNDPEKFEDITYLVFFRPKLDLP